MKSNSKAPLRLQKFCPKCSMISISKRRKFYLCLNYGHIFTKPMLADKENLGCVSTRLQIALEMHEAKNPNKILHYPVNLWASSRLTFRVKGNMIESWKIEEALEGILKKPNS